VVNRDNGIEQMPVLRHVERLTEGDASSSFTLQEHFSFPRTLQAGLARGLREMASVAIGRLYCRQLFVGSSGFTESLRVTSLNQKGISLSSWFGLNLPRFAVELAFKGPKKEDADCSEQLLLWEIAFSSQGEIQAVNMFENRPYNASFIDLFTTKLIDWGFLLNWGDLNVEIQTTDDAIERIDDSLASF